MDCSREMMETIVEMVLKEIQRIDCSSPVVPQGKHLLVILCGGMLGSKESMEQLKQLHADGYQLRVLFTPAGERVLGADWVHKALPGIPIIPANAAEAPAALIKEADAVVVPVLTFNTAAKVACGIADNLATSVLSQALLQGKPVFAASDACNPDNPKLPCGELRNSAYRNRLYDNIVRLKQYGMGVISASALSNAVNQGLQPIDGMTNDDCTKSRGRDTSVVFSDSVLSVSNILQWPHKTIITGKRTLVTPAARDVALQHGVRIVTEL